jgi:hypothetical protein
MRLASGYQISQAIIVAARLKIAEHLVAGPKTSEELAHITNTPAPSLYRLMRALSAAGVFRELADRTFENTDLSGHLHRHLDPLRGQIAYQMFGDLLESVRTGEAAFPRIFGSSFFDYLKAHSQEAEAWNRWNTDTAREWLPAVAKACDFVSARMVVDVGGGQGTLLAEILKNNSSLKGTLYDLPNVVKDAGSILDAAGFSTRAQVVPGNFLESVPVGGDVYVISRVLFNWNDDDALKILRNTRRAMTMRARLLVIEALLPRPDDPNYLRLALNDIRLWLAFNSRHRTEEEYRDLFGRAGFGLSRVVATEDTWRILEGVPL